MFLTKKVGDFNKKESESLDFTGLKIPRDYKYEMEGNGENERTKFERYIKKCPDFGKNNKGTSEWLAELLGENIYEKSKRKE